MKYRNLGKYGLKVSEVALGSWMTDLGDKEKQIKAREVIDLAYQKGVNFLTVQMDIVMVQLNVF